MKKFLSSLLALTMILSLVVVPARAAAETKTLGSWSVDMSATEEQRKHEFQVSDTLADGTKYKWTSEKPSIVAISGSDSANKVTVEAKAKGQATITCVATIPAADDKNGETTVSYTATVTVTDYANEFDSSKVNDFTFHGRVYTATQVAKVSYLKNDTFSKDSFTTTLKDTKNYKGLSCSYSGNAISGTITVSAKTTVGETPVSFNISVTPTLVELDSPTIAVKDNSVHTESGKRYIREGEKGTLIAQYTSKLGTADANLTYEWYIGGSPIPRSNDKELGLNDKSTFPASSTPYNITVKVTDNGDSVTSDPFVLNVNADTYEVKAGRYKTSMIANQTQPLEIIIDKQATGTDYSVAWNSSKTDIATINESGKIGTLTAKNKTGSTKVTAVVTYLNKDYTVDFGTISVEAADAKFGSVKNGDSDYYTDSQLTSLVVDAINKISTSSYTASDVTSIKIKELPNHVTLYADKIESSASLKKNADLTTPDRIYYEADKGYIDTDGDKTQLIVDVQLKNAGTPTVTISIPVVGDETIKETVTGNAANKDVTFTNSDYKYLYYTTSKVSDYDGYYTGSRVGVFGLPVAEDKTVTIPASAFKDKTTVTLYVVGLDKYDVASTGTIEVSQKSYAIEYNVVAGETLSFDQKAFESFMNDYADDNISTSKGDYFEFDYVKFTSLPNSTREGVLYEGKDKIKTSTEVENLDKVSFESVAKAKDTIKVPFTLYAKQYDKNDKVIDKKVSMTGEVVISVVKEDIVFEVGVNSAVKLGSDKFIDFLRDSDKSYKKADLDYVTFDVGKNSAITSYFNGTGALYRYYNGSTGINATVSAKDEFYYNPKTSSKHYDLDDVTYVTSKFAKVGDIVYIPFTAYGTKSGQKAEGTLAIKVKQTMNFVDVRPGDYFYDSVQWAVNLDITKGTSATTFSPKQGCTRAQIVTFLWRAANSPAPRSSTNKFTDVYATTHADYMKAIIWATEQGITTGTGNGKFSPDDTCTRAQIVTFLYRFKNNPAVYGSLNFSDVNKTEHAAFYNAILWAVNNKITTGYGNGIFDPNGTCNRGDAVTFLYRALA